MRLWRRTRRMSTYAKTSLQTRWPETYRIHNYIERLAWVHLRQSRGKRLPRSRRVLSWETCLLMKSSKKKKKEKRKKKKQSGKILQLSLLSSQEAILPYHPSLHHRRHLKEQLPKDLQKHFTMTGHHPHCSLQYGTIDLLPTLGLENPAHLLYCLQILQ